MLAADRPAARATKRAAGVNHERAAALGAYVGLVATLAIVLAADQDLAVPAAVTVDGDALAAQTERQLVGGAHVSGRGVAAQVDGLGHRGVDVPLPRRLHADVPLDVDVVRRRKQPAQLAADPRGAA